MSREIEADYIDNCTNENKQCHLCDSYQINNSQNYCNELEQEISETGTCDFFRAR